MACPESAAHPPAESPFSTGSAVIQPASERKRQEFGWKSRKAASTTSCNHVQTWKIPAGQCGARTVSHLLLNRSMLQQVCRPLDHPAGCRDNIGTTCKCHAASWSKTYTTPYLCCCLPRCVCRRVFIQLQFYTYPAVAELRNIAESESVVAQLLQVARWHNFSQEQLRMGGGGGGELTLHGPVFG